MLYTFKIANIMEIILSKQCESLTGSIGRGFGYYIRSFYCRRKNVTHYYAQRSKHSVPPDGHLRFILTCANLAQNKLHIADIRVSVAELHDALWEAGLRKAAAYITAHRTDFPNVFCKDDIINFKNKHNL